VIHLTAHRSLSVVPTHRRSRLGVSLGVVGLLGLLLLSAAATVSAAPARAESPGPWAPSVPASAFNPPCAPINVSGVCVSVANATEPDIVPETGTQSPVEPSAATNLPLLVKSEQPLNGTSSASARSGPNAPIILNVTGTLWDGIPFYSVDDGSVYHSATAQWWDGPISTTNTTYPWWYLVNISADASNGQPEFFPGMSITWSIEITYNVSGNFLHEGGPNGPQFHYTYKGAWPESPYANARQYDGSAAYGQDLTTTVLPSQPNWNDTVRVNLNTTPADVAQSASIGQAYLDLSQTAENGTPLADHTFVYANTNGSGTGVPRIHFTIPAVYAQQANSTVSYTVHVSDAWGDWIESPLTTYLVGGNGSFSVGQFGDDLLLSSHPSVTLPVAPILPGTPVALSLLSANAHTAIASATLFYTVDLPVLNEVSAFSERLSRVNSTSFVGTIPGLPLGAGVNFTVEAWDFASTGETSSNFNYSVQPLTTVLPSIAQNGSFFYVAVHDAGLNSWVNGAVVTIAGPGGYFRSVGTTFAGLAYPNGTSAPFAPIVVPAGQTYLISVADPTFRPTGGPATRPVQVELSATHAMGAHGILAANSTYTVYQNGDLIVFWLNGTVAAPTSTPPNSTPLLIGSIGGLAVASLIVFPLLGWWRRIQKRREEETKRITL